MHSSNLSSTSPHENTVEKRNIMPIQLSINIIIIIPLHAVISLQFINKAPSLATNRPTPSTYPSFNHSTPTPTPQAPCFSKNAVFHVSSSLPHHPSFWRPETSIDEGRPNKKLKRFVREEEQPHPSIRPSIQTCRTNRMPCDAGKE